ncbi:SCO3870 family protein [Streptomyces mordarskii]|uniref:SCO3870 family protein n=1 Tax=Streptomyces mordarskii TaxID=1226758 RepID=UPI001C8EC9D6
MAAPPRPPPVLRLGDAVRGGGGGIADRWSCGALAGSSDARPSALVVVTWVGDGRPHAN